MFQHIPPARGERIFQVLQDRLGVGGVAVVHFTDASSLRSGARVGRWFQQAFPLGLPIINLLNGEPLGKPQMQMYDYDLNRLFRISHRSECDTARIHFTNHGGYLARVSPSRDGLTAAARWGEQQAEC
ncbi:MAG TPA: hypothetical protein VF881_14485 [Polyangiaceae bacterium]